MKTATFALKRMLTRYNFGAARDPEILHKIYNAEPVAPIIEIPRRAITKTARKFVMDVWLVFGGMFKMLHVELVSL